jgi:hypothetical protein
MNNIIIKNKYQKILSITICSLISYQPVVHFINIVTNILFGLEDGFIFDTLFCYIILLFMIIRSLTLVINDIKPDILFISFAFLICYLTSYLVSGGNREFMFTSISDLMGNPIYTFLVFSYSGYIFTRYINNYSIINYYLKRFSIGVVLLSTITFLFLVKQGTQPEYMVFSYNMLVHTIYLFIDFVEHKKLSDGMVSILGLIMIFIGGARGPIIIFIYTIIIYFLLRKEGLYKKVIGVFLLIVTVIIIYSNFENIIRWLIYIADVNSIDSRTLKMIIDNNFFDSSGRDKIYELLINSISLLGTGLYGDRAISGFYAHNVIIELLVQFGYTIGPLIILMLVIVIANGIVSKNKSIQNLSIIFISSGFLKLFLSGSYLNQEPCLYILLALGVNSICLRRENKDEDIVVMQHNVT